MNTQILIFSLTGFIFISLITNLPFTTMSVYEDLLKRVRQYTLSPSVHVNVHFTIVPSVFNQCQDVWFVKAYLNLCVSCFKRQYPLVNNGVYLIRPLVVRTMA